MQPIWKISEAAAWISLKVKKTLRNYELYTEMIKWYSKERVFLSFQGEQMIKFIGVYDYTVILTYISLISAVFGMTQAIHGDYRTAIFCLAFSGLCDAFDGRVARTKKNRTEDEKAFGIQLDSLCDVICFGIFPAFLCYFMGVKSIIGMLFIFLYPLCAVIRLAYFNVLESNRQKTEGGANKYYRGLPVTSIAIIFPLVYLLTLILPHTVDLILLHLMLGVVAFLFVLDFAVKKPDFKKLLRL